MNKADEKRQLVSVLTAVSDVRKRAITYMVAGEITVDGRDLVFYLDNREYRRLSFYERPYVYETIFFNKNGIASGGEIFITLKKNYKIVVEPVSGKVRVE